jgi:hypothetical protein
MLVNNDALKAKQAAIAELMRQLADRNLSAREREALKRRLKELQRRPSGHKHGADKKRGSPDPGAGGACMSMVGRKCDKDKN